LFWKKGKTRYLNEVMLFLLKFVRYKTKTCYRDPVLFSGVQKPPVVVQQLTERTDVLKKEFSMTPTNSDISVIIPFYNREQYVDEAIHSVLAQTLKPLEIIIVNDCSRESSRRYLDRYTEVCKIVDLPKNVGLAGSRNAGIRVARGKFIALLDDDDIWLPEKLEVQRRYMEEYPDCTVVHSSVSAFFTNFPDQVYGRFDSGPMTLAQALRDEYWAVPSTLMMRTEPIRAIGGFDVGYRECEDRDFLIRCCAAGYKVEGIREPLIRFRRTIHNSLSEQLWRMFRAHARIVWKHRKLYYRAYGIRGASNFVMVTLHMGSFQTRYVDGAVRFLLRLHGRKWVIKPGYRDPVQSSQEDRPVPMEIASVPAAGPRRHSA
jgi:glycosyltransferase involved in cell wall biosynthesis